MRSLFLLLTFLLAANSYALKVKDEEVILEKLDDYKLCQSRDGGGKFCHEALSRWVEQNPADAFAAGKLTRLHMNHWAAIPYFYKAKDEVAFDCKDQDVKLAIESAGDLPSDPKNEIKTQAAELKAMCKARKKK